MLNNLIVDTEKDIFLIIVTLNPMWVLGVAVSL